jgi:hypothetical protein
MDHCVKLTRFFAQIAINCRSKKRRLLMPASEKLVLQIHPVNNVIVALQKPILYLGKEAFHYKQ